MSVRVLVLAIALAAVACGPGVRQPQPGALLAEAWRLAARSEVREARARLDAFRLQAKTAPPVLQWESRLLEAELLVMQRKEGDALGLLADPPPPELQHSPLAVRRTMTLGLACALLARAGDSVRATELLSEAAAQALKLNDRRLHAEVEQRRSVQAMRERRPEAALAHLRTALETARAEGDGSLEVRVLGNLGVLAGQRNRFSEAIDWLETARSGAQQWGMRSAESKLLGNLGWCYRSIGESEKAEERLNTALRLAADHGLAGDQQTWLLNLGNMQFDRGRYAEAHGLYLRSLEVGTAAELPAAHHNLVLTAVRLGRADLAEEYHRRAVEGDRNREDPQAKLYGRITAARIAALRGRLAEAEAELRRVVGDAAGEPQIAWSAHSELGAVLAAANRPAQAADEYGRAIAMLSQARADLVREEHRLTFQSRQVELYQSYVTLLMEQGRQREALAVVDYSRTRSLEERLGGGKLASSVLAHERGLGAPRPDTAALVDWLGDNGSYLWCLTSSRLTSHKLPARRLVETAVDDYRRVLHAPLPDEAGVRRRGQELYAMLVAPAAPDLRGRTRLAVVADGALHRLDLGAVVTPGDGLHFLVEDATVVVLPALRSPGARARPEPTRLLLTLGNSRTEGTSVPPLPQSGREMRMVASHFDAARTVMLEKAAAVPSAYASAHPETFRYIHLAAHGTGNSVNPLDSALLLSPEPQGHRLYARDVLSLPIGAEVVTVSACHGTGTRTYQGEGLVGLAWAFLRAGAGTVVAALTEVSDSATPRLMDRFYAEIARGVAPAQALRAAKLELLRSGTVHRHPQYWSSFMAYSRE